MKEAIPILASRQLKFTSSDSSSCRSESARSAGEEKQDVTLLESEFAAVEVSVDVLGHDPRLRVRDLRNGNEVLLDAFALSSLAGAHWRTFEELANPASASWGTESG